LGVKDYLEAGLPDWLQGDLEACSDLGVWYGGVDVKAVVAYLHAQGAYGDDFLLDKYGLLEKKEESPAGKNELDDSGLGFDLPDDRLKQLRDLAEMWNISLDEACERVLKKGLEDYLKAGLRA
jgi:hypothetical protein